MTKHTIGTLVFMLAGSMLAASATGAQPTLTDVFTAGEAGCHSYRIPSVITTAKGTLLAFCEARKVSLHDQSPTDLVLKRSVDGGRTWLPIQTVLDGKQAAFMDPTPVIDQSTGTIFLVVDRWPEGGYKAKRLPGFGIDSVTAWVTQSNDDGLTWSEPRDITPTTKEPHWTGIAHGPGVGIQDGKGRLLVPCTQYIGGMRAHLLISDDHGKSWHLGGQTSPKMSETQVVELADGTLVLNMRSDRGKKCRAVATSSDGGLTWTEPVDEPQLIEPVCQASILRYSLAGKQDKNRLLFANPATRGGRTNGSVRISYDEGKTWPVVKTIYPGSFAYCCLTVLPDMSIGCLFERDNYSKITFAHFTLDWLTDGKDTLRPKAK